jgi:hypothetical protein
MQKAIQPRVPGKLRSMERPEQPPDKKIPAVDQDEEQNLERQRYGSGRKHHHAH